MFGKHVAALACALTMIGCGSSHGEGPQPFSLKSPVAYDVTDAARVALVYEPLDRSPRARPWIFGIHGGAFMGGSPADLEVYACEFCPEGYVVVSVNYHLTTEKGVTWPRPLRDCQAALRFFRAHAADFGLDPERFVVMGGSAGGCLATHLGLDDDPEGPLGRARHVVDFAGEQDLRLLGGCMSNDAQITERLLGHPAPWTDGELLGPSNVGHARADVDFFIVHGTANDDTYVLNSDIMADELAKAGAQVEYHRVAGCGMWAAQEPKTNAALHAWTRSRLSP